MSTLPGEAPGGDASPYAAPQAAVADADVHVQRMPPAVRRALILSWTGLVITSIFPVYSIFLSDFFDDDDMPDTEAIVRALFTLGTIGFMVLVNIKIAAGRNWARTVFIIMVALMITINLYRFLVILWSLTFFLSVAAVLLLYGGALLLLLTRPAREWFRAMKAR